MQNASIGSGKGALPMHAAILKFTDVFSLIGKSMGAKAIGPS
jgi:hypothetical protein